MSAPRHEKICWFEVAMDDVGLVRCRERVGKFDCHIDQRLVRKPPAFPQRLPLQQFHDQEGLPLDRVDFVNRADVRVVQSGGGARFALKPLQRARVGREIVGEHLQGHEPSEPGVLRPVNDTHAAGAKSVNDAVMRDGLADHLFAT